MKNDQNPSKACLFQNDDIINFVPIRNNPLINEVSSHLGIDIRPTSTALDSSPQKGPADGDEEEDAISPIRSDNRELARWLLLKTDTVQVDGGRFSRETRVWKRDVLTPVQQAQNLLNFVRRDLEKIKKIKSSIISDQEDSQARTHGLTSLEKWAAIELVNTQHKIHQGLVSKLRIHAYVACENRGMKFDPVASQVNQSLFRISST